ncbi:Phosphotyrosyl phosphatase activator [Rhizodiscina lignyota]|uniref:Serine/threonine-protein phosphatase 2A activator n=1 Tax=Rhizodiscina lignyota TaxID=1504668 RepID=A0A9P4INZ8_9PEZI|nr:Phosphotyrosyl phosphatase activator [Rhizodiscina lignyota]
MAQVSSTSPLAPDLSQKLPRLVPRGRQKAAAPPSEPPPETPPLPPPPSLDSIAFTHPTRRILSPKDHERFLSSPTYTLILAFIFGVSDSVRDTPISAVSKDDLHPTVSSLLSILDDAEAILKECPPEDTGSRFGNPAFRSFLDALTARAPQWHSTTGPIPLPSAGAVDEATTYLTHAFGNWQRIDYGSGHELNFLIYLLCLERLSLLPASTFPSLALLVFPRYLRLMRQVQTSYYLEPAGSHGVWGLDDYQFLPFLLGAAQLARHRFITPKSIHQPFVVEEYAREYLYLDQVAFVNSVKNIEGLRWHSPMLDDISAARSWEKVEAGMKKMFVKEVLGKLPVMQHFLFGGLVPAAEGMGNEGDTGAAGGENVDDEEGEVVVDENGMRHVHKPNQWGDCCGIKVPSSAGAIGEMRKRMGSGDQLRRVPFD